MPESIVPWRSPVSVIVPPGETVPRRIADLAIQLRAIERSQLISAYENNHFEMASFLVWTKAMAALRRQLATLGAEFIGEILQRPDIGRGSDFSKIITDSEAITLAEHLQMFSATEGMRLRHAHEVVVHFANMPAEASDDDRMTAMEAVQCLHSCVQSLLGHQNLSIAAEFVTFRKALEERTFQESDQEILILQSAPYFYWRTTLSVLLSLLKTAEGAQLEHASRNLSLLLPRFWPGLQKPERWQTGQAYAELFSAGKKSAVSALKQVLSAVRGFDYVPENLRSNTFARAAHEVQAAHEGIDNFYNEAAPMAALANLGSTIPSPALAACLRATLSVWLGNRYGNAWNAEENAKVILLGLSRERWEHYLNEFLPGDEVILSKLIVSKPSIRWCKLFADFEAIKQISGSTPRVHALIAASRQAQFGAVQSIAKSMLDSRMDTKS